VFPGRRPWAQIQQLQRALDGSQPLGADVEIDAGGGEATVAHEPLDDRQFDPRFQQVGGETVAQTVNSATIRQLSPLDCAPEPALSRAGRQRTRGILRRRKQPGLRAVDPPISAQLLEQAGRE
jgi:hypothetical protein